MHLLNANKIKYDDKFKSVGNIQGRKAGLLLRRWKHIHDINSHQLF